MDYALSYYWTISIDDLYSYISNNPQTIKDINYVEWKNKNYDNKDANQLLKDLENKDIKDLESEINNFTEETEPTIHVYAQFLPTLIQETVKGIYEMIGAYTIKQGYEDVYEDNHINNQDYSKMSKSQLNDLLNKALEDGDMETASKIGSYFKESFIVKFDVFLESVSSEPITKPITKPKIEPVKPSRKPSPIRRISPEVIPGPKAQKDFIKKLLSILKQSRNKELAQIILMKYHITPIGVIG